MTIAEIPGLGRFELDWHTEEYPTPDPGADPWIVELDTVWWMSEHPTLGHLTGITVNRHALWHKMPDGRTLYETLEFWVYEHEEPEYSEPDYSDW